MKFGNVELTAMPVPPGPALKPFKPAAPVVQLWVGVGSFIRHRLDVSPDQARGLAVELLSAAGAAEGRDGQQ